MNLWLAIALAWVALLVAFCALWHYRFAARSRIYDLAELNEPVLPDHYPVYAGQRYVVDGRVIESPATGTVADMKDDEEINAREVRRCDIVGRRLMKSPLSNQKGGEA